MEPTSLRLYASHILTSFGPYATLVFTIPGPHVVNVWQALLASPHHASVVHASVVHASAAEAEVALSVVALEDVASRNVAAVATASSVGDGAGDRALDGGERRTHRGDAAGGAAAVVVAADGEGGGGGEMAVAEAAASTTLTPPSSPLPVPPQVGGYMPSLLAAIPPGALTIAGLALLSLFAVLITAPLLAMQLRNLLRGQTYIESCRSPPINDYHLGMRANLRRYMDACMHAHTYVILHKYVYM